MEQKIIVISCMHGRHSTVKYCLEKMPFIDVVMIYSNDEDGEFLDQFENVMAKAKVKNKPLSHKWNTAIKCLAQVDFDAVILLGSDDYIDEAFLEFASKNIKGFDMIGFHDAYYESEQGDYYWRGYDNHRKGEPVGAGKVYSRKFLESIGYNLFPEHRDIGLDGISWRVVKRSNAKVKIFSLKEEGIKLYDVKDGLGMNSMDKLIRTLKGFERI